MNLGTVLALAILLVFLGLIARRGERIPVALCDETTGWIVAGAVCFYMLLDVSAPVWWVLSYLPTMTFPWRMQLGMNLAVMMLFTVFARYLGGKHHLKNWKQDFLVGVGVLMIANQTNIAMHHEFSLKLLERITSARVVPQCEYLTRWSPERECLDMDLYTDRKRFFHTVQKRHNTPRAQVTVGQAELAIRQWGAGTIMLGINAQTAAEIRIRQRYFPTWQVEGGVIEPEPEHGYIRLKVPAGEDQTVTISQQPEAFSPWIRIANWVSGITALGLIVWSWVTLAARRRASLPTR